MQRRTMSALSGAGVLALLALAVTGCAQGSDESPTSDGAAPLTYLDTSDGTCAAGPHDGVDFDSAEAYIQKYQVKADRIFQTEPLPEPLPSDLLMIYANNDTPVADAYWKPWAEEAAQTAGVQFQNVSVGVTAESQQAGFNTIVSLDPDIVIMGAIDPTFVQDQVEQLVAEGAVVVPAAQPNIDQFDLEESLGGDGASYVNGKVLGAGAVYFTCGTADEFVFYNIPELTFSQVVLEGAEDYLEELNPNANLRVVDISIGDPDPASKIVSDLQAHPETTFFITPADQYQIGLSEAASLAGLENAYGLGQSSLPANYEQIQDGTQVAGDGTDYQAFMYLIVDQSFRQYQDVFTPWTDEDWEELYPLIQSVITVQNVEDYPEGNFVAYENTQADFAKLWGK